MQWWAVALCMHPYSFDSTDGSSLFGLVSYGIKGGIMCVSSHFIHLVHRYLKHNQTD